MKHALLILTILLLAITPGYSERPDAISFTRDIRPILSNKCYKCHGPDEDARVSEMRLDTQAGLFDKAIPPVSPHNLKKSQLIQRVLATDPDIKMPPASANKDLTAEELELLQAWVRQGADWEPHWAFQPVRDPKVIQRRGDWGNSGLDSFILSKLREANLSPSQAADPHTLIRRLYLDLIGIPPSVEELDDAIQTVFDQQGHILAEPYSALVDKLIDRPQYGERWARRWLDLARYADTNGYEKDRDRNMWPYRDWVIQSINSRMPFHQFTIEQLAGDLLPGATANQRIATGFHRNTMLNEEGGIDPLEFRFYAMTDRVATTGTTWLGLTTGCAQCHTHKYDPITHRQYYEFMAFMNNTDEPEMDIPDTNIDQQHQDNLARAVTLIGELEQHYNKAGKSLETEYPKWLSEQRSRRRNWSYLSPDKMSTNLPHLELEPDHIVYASGDSTKHDVFELEYDVEATGIQAIRLEALPDARLPNYGPGMTNYEGTIGDFFLTEFLLTVDGKPVRFTKALHSYAKNRYGNQDTSAALMIDGDIQTGWSVHNGQGQRHLAVLKPEQPIPAGRWKLEMHFGRHFSSSLGKFRLSVATDDRPLSTEELGDTAESLLAIPDNEQTDAQRNILQHEFLLLAPELKEQAGRIRKLQQKPPYQRAMVMQERPLQNPRQTYRHHRGEFLSPKEEVTPEPLAFLHQYNDDLPKNRLGFAQWIIDPTNPLTARVVVNRHWDAFFGKGIVATVDDFGFQGTPPTHPDLLDHLASKLIENNWSIQWLHKYIATSATYQQSSVFQAATLNKDPGNHLLSYFPRTRLDAEIIRDSVLQSAGLLSEKMYGPPVKPLQPQGVSTAAYGSPKWVASIGEDRYRRSIYTYTKRTAPFAMFNTFDGPSGEFCTAKRDRSNTALQALTMLNDVMFLDIAKQFGKELAEQKSSAEETLSLAYKRIFSRPPTVDEMSEVLDFYHSAKDHYRSNPELANVFTGLDGIEGIESASWAVVVRALFSTDEVVTRN